MTVTEKRRRGLATKADEVFGPEHGSTLMELLNPPWDTLATKDDLAALATSLRAEMDVRFAELELRMERSIRTSILAAMGIQTTVIGILLGLFAAFG